MEVVCDGRVLEVFLPYATLSPFPPPPPPRATPTSTCAPAEELSMPLHSGTTIADHLLLSRWVYTSE